MHVAIGLLLIALLLLGCWAILYAIILMRPHVRELREVGRLERQRHRMQVRQQRQEWRDYLAYLRIKRLATRGPPLRLIEKLEAIFWLVVVPAIIVFSIVKLAELGPMASSVFN
jgi:hypothetical protein